MTILMPVTFAVNTPVVEVEVDDPEVDDEVDDDPEVVTALVVNC